MLSHVMLCLLVLGAVIQGGFGEISNEKKVKKTPLDDLVKDIPLPGRLELHTFESFPENKIALHFSCKESNMFATNCACHLKCTTPNCANAIHLCHQYSDTVGCRYIFIRGYKNKIATLKRVPTEAERAAVDVSIFDTHAAAQPTLSHPSHDLKAVLDVAGKYGHDTLAPFAHGRIAQDRKCLPGTNMSDAAAVERATTKWNQQQFLRGGIGLATVSYRRPMTLLNSLRSWHDSGLLDLMQDRLAILNDPLPAEVNMAKHFGLRTIQPDEMLRTRPNRKNVITIGVAFYEALHRLDTDYVLFLENDFKVDPALSVEEIAGELLAATAMLDRGAQIVRLQSRKGQGCGTFKACDHESVNHLRSPVPKKRVRNWMSFYCKHPPNSADGRAAAPHVSDCIPASSSEVKSPKRPSSQSKQPTPEYRCFSSADSNWSLNAVLVNRKAILNKKYKYGRTGPTHEKSIPEIGYAFWDKQDAFETVMVHDIGWMKWKVPLCISLRGVFLHEEIETGA